MRKAFTAKYLRDLPLRDKAVTISDERSPLIVIVSKTKRQLAVVARWLDTTVPAKRNLPVEIDDAFDDERLRLARRMATEWKEGAKATDPYLERETALAASREAKKASADRRYSILLDRYIRAKEMQGDRQSFEVKKTLTRDAGHLRDMPVDKITKADVEKVLLTIFERGAQRQAHNTFIDLRAFLNWCVDEEIIADAPTKKIKPSRLLGPKVVRDRRLSDLEVRGFWFAAFELGYPYGDALRLLMLTGARLMDVLHAEWKDYDPEKGTLLVPKERFKSKRDHRIVLSKAAKEIIEALPSKGQRWFFSVSGEAPVYQMPSWAKHRADAHMREFVARRDPAYEFQPHKVHDLRRLVGEGMIELGINPLMVKLCLGHKLDPLSETYMRTENLASRAVAMESWGSHLRSIVHDWNDQGEGIVVFPARA